MKETCMKRSEGAATTSVPPPPPPRLETCFNKGPHFQPMDTVNQKQKLSWQACAELEQSCYEEQNLKTPHSKESCAKGLLRDEPDARANDATCQSAPPHTQKLEPLKGCANLNAKLEFPSSLIVAPLGQVEIGLSWNGKRRATTEAIAGMWPRPSGIRDRFIRTLKAQTNLEGGTEDGHGKKWLSTMFGGLKAKKKADGGRLLADEDKQAICQASYVEADDPKVGTRVLEIHIKKQTAATSATINKTPTRLPVGWKRAEHDGASTCVTQQRP